MSARAASAAPSAGITNETDVYENVLCQHTDDALEPEGYCANVRMWGNTIEDVHMAFAVAPAAPGPTWIVRNVAYDFGNTRTSQVDGYLASALKINSGYPEPVGPLLLLHNTFLTTAPGTAALTLLNPGESTFIVARNNLFAGHRGDLQGQPGGARLGPGRPLPLDRRAGSSTGRERRYARSRRVPAGDRPGADGPLGRARARRPRGGDFTPLAASPLVDRGAA